jgi:hypothetical protein
MFYSRSSRRQIMRALILAIVISAALLGAPAASAAPTCQDQNGGTIKCGIPGAMPVGWRLSAQQRLDRHMPEPQYPSANELLKLICIMGVFFAVMALMPEFDGRRAGDWDRQEDDDEDRR